MQANSRKLAEDIAAIGQLSIIGDEDSEQLPLVAFQLAQEQSYDEFDIGAQLASERGWMVPAYTLPPDADHIKIMRTLIKETLGRSLTMRSLRISRRRARRSKTKAKSTTASESASTRTPATEPRRPPRRSDEDRREPLSGSWPSRSNG
jgi:glutamate/tyrosine decarboxylase-like PLP-dependent enzyme